jgi:hypothetical protein
MRMKEPLDQAIDEFEFYLARRIKAHREVVSRWQEERTEDLKRLRDIYEGHVEDALYEPLRYHHDVEEAFYEEVEQVTAEVSYDPFSEEDYRRIFWYGDGPNP